MVLILGARGMLGGELKKVFPNSLAWDHEECDVRDAFDLKSKILSANPEAVINCVAFNDVDGAESRHDIANVLNCEVPKNLSIICKELNIPLVHFSTNYVFGDGKGLYKETDEPTPNSVYSQSKFNGEREIIKNSDKYYIIRTAVLFGPKGKSELSKRSFIDLMLELGNKSATIKAVSDEINSVTFVKDLAENVKMVLDSKQPFGIYHVTNSGYASWYDLAKYVFLIKNMKADLVPVKSTEFPRAAKRPSKSVLINTKLPQLRTWQDALKDYLLNY